MVSVRSGLGLQHRSLSNDLNCAVACLRGLATCLHGRGLVPHEHGRFHRLILNMEATVLVRY